MLLQLIGLVVVVSLIAAGAAWAIKNIRFGADTKTEVNKEETK